jgi:hypothetical protein
MVLRLIQLVYGADGEVMCRGDHARRQVGITEMVLDERLDAEHHGAASALGGHDGHAVKPGCNGERQQVKERRPDPGVTGAFLGVEVPGALEYLNADHLFGAELKLLGRAVVCQVRLAGCVPQSGLGGCHRQAV